MKLKRLAVLFVVIGFVTASAFADTITLQPGHYQCPGQKTVPRIYIGDRLYNDTCLMTAYYPNGNERYTYTAKYNAYRNELDWSGHTFKIINETCFKWQGDIYTLERKYW
jgi:hypothetical protein